MADYYKGDEIKFAIELTAPGFSMDGDGLCTTKAPSRPIPRRWSKRVRL